MLNPDEFTSDLRNQAMHVGVDASRHRPVGKDGISPDDLNVQRLLSMRAPDLVSTAFTKAHQRADTSGSYMPPGRLQGPPKVSDDEQRRAMAEGLAQGMTLGSRHHPKDRP